MANIEEKNNLTSVILPLPFLAKYLPIVSGEYLRVYMAYEFFRSSKEQVTEERIADLLDTTEKMVKKALLYWQEEGLLKVDKYEEEDTSLEVTELNLSGSVIPQIIAFAGIYLGRELTTREVSILNEIKESCHFDFSLFQYLFDYCINKKKKNFTYMKKVAVSWKEKGIRSVADAEYEMSSYADLASAVSKAFGITNRMLGSGEIKYIETWIGKKIPKELVVEACQRTILYAGKISFPYADKILNGWMTQGVETLDDLKRIDQVHKDAAKEKKENKKGNQVQKSTNQFHNFEQRTDEYDWDALENALRNKR